MSEPVRWDAHATLARIQEAVTNRPLDVGDEPTRSDAELLASTDGIDEWRHRRWTSLVPRRFLGADLAAFEGEPYHADLSDWAADPDGRNLVILGPIGSGKTTAAVAACKPAFMAGADFRFYPVDELLDRLRPGSDEQPFINLSVIDRLVVDDLGGERRTEWTAERVYSLVNRRWLEEAPLAVTSNLSPKDLEDAVGARTFSRLIHGALVIVVTGDDRRRAR